MSQKQRASNNAEETSPPARSSPHPPPCGSPVSRYVAGYVKGCAHFIPGCFKGHPLKRCSTGEARFLRISWLPPPQAALSSRNGPSTLLKPETGVPFKVSVPLDPGSQPPSLQRPPHPSETPHSCNNTGPLLTSITLPATWLCLPCPLPVSMQGSSFGLESFF